METVLAFLGGLAAIVVINLMLSGDNAIVIALAARSVPQRLQRKAILFGTAGAVVVRIAMTLGVVWLLEIPGLLFVGGVALIWIGYKLLIPEDDANEVALHSGNARSMWGAIRTIVAADIVMGVDNVIGVAGAAQGSYVLVILGLVTSIPIVVWGSTWLLKWVERFPVIVYVGAGVLLWTAATMIVHEPLAQDAVSHMAIVIPLYVIVVCGVLWAGLLRNHRHLESRIHARIAQLRAAHPHLSDPKGGSMNVVLVPVSDLPNSHLAVERVAAEFPRNPDMVVHLLNVRKPLSKRVSRFVRRSLREDDHRENAAVALEPARKMLDRHRIPYEVHVRVGDPATLIADEAKRIGADRIVMATARTGSITRIIEDSTTERVLHLTSVPVEIVVSDAVSKLERYGVPAAIAAIIAGFVAFLLVAD